MNIELSWTDIKTLNTTKNLNIQYADIGKFYRIWIQEFGVFYVADIYKIASAPSGSDQKDFEDNYKSNTNKPIVPIDVDGKTYVRAESRPLNKTTYFTCAGDSASEIGDGKELKWDFSNSNDDITAPTNFKRKRIEFNFIDAINIKEGSIYFKGVPKGCYIDLIIVCPDGQYYLDNDGIPVLASEDTQVEKFVNKHFLYGDCSLGDELNTEASSSEIPSTYKFWIEITTPDTDSTSFGHVSIELYRARTRIL